MTGKKVILKPARNFIEYSQNLLENKYDLVFDSVGESLHKEQS